MFAFSTQNQPNYSISTNKHPNYFIFNKGTTELFHFQQRNNQQNLFTVEFRQNFMAAGEKISRLSFFKINSFISKIFYLEKFAATGK